MTRREIAFLLIGLGFGLLLSIAVVVQVFLSLYRNGTISGYGFDKLVLILPILLLVTGIILLAYRKKAERIES